MEDKLCFVQFIHPGGEHKPTHDMVTKWNQRNHKRKFIEQKGSYLNNDEVKKGNLMFWGEWEAQSNTKTIFSPQPNGPKYFHRPYYTIPPDTKKGLSTCARQKGGSCGVDTAFQNTDPFVFGKAFFYSNCKQKITNQLQHFKQGSVILFGSCVKKSFVLDTVFVVHSWKDYGIDYKKQLKGMVSDAFIDVTLSKLTYSFQTSYRLYFGATYKNNFMECIVIFLASRLMRIVAVLFVPK